MGLKDGRPCNHTMPTKSRCGKRLSLLADRSRPLTHPPSPLSPRGQLNYESGKFSKSRGVGVFGDGAMATGIESEVRRWREKGGRRGGRFTNKDRFECGNSSEGEEIGL